MDTDKKDCETIVTVTTLAVTCGSCRKRVTADFVLDSHTLPACPICGHKLKPCPICSTMALCHGHTYFAPSRIVCLYADWPAEDEEGGGR